MTLQYDLNARSLYIELGGGEVDRTCEAGGNCHVDLDEDGRVTGIEVISVDHPWPLEAILAGYPVGDRDAALLRVCFPPDADGMARAQAPVMTAVPR